MPNFSRRSFLNLLLASAAAESVDFERLLWTPKPIITVPAINQATYSYWVESRAGCQTHIALESLKATMREIYNKCSAGVECPPENWVIGPNIS